jgi:hypothetical protein
VKSTLEWARLGKFVFDLLVAVFSWRLAKKLLTYAPRVSQDWASIIAWLTAAVVLFVLIRWEIKHKEQEQGPSVQDASGALLNSSTFNATAHFANAYISTMYEEILNNTRTAAQLNSPNDRESFYLKLIATGLPQFTYDLIWAYIFKSQILALMEINRQIVPVAKVKEFYTKAAAEFPDRYSTYSFEQWMEFLKSNTLLLWHPSGMVQITVQGRDFLKYLTHCGRYPDDRSF